MPCLQSTFTNEKMELFNLGEDCKNKMNEFRRPCTVRTNERVIVAISSYRYKNIAIDGFYFSEKENEYFHNYMMKPTIF